MKKHERFFGLRVGKEELEAIDILCKRLEQRRSDAARFAICKTARERDNMTNRVSQKRNRITPNTSRINRKRKPSSKWRKLLRYLRPVWKYIQQFSAFAVKNVSALIQLANFFSQVTK